MLKLLKTIKNLLPNDIQTIHMNNNVIPRRFCTIIGSNSSDEMPDLTAITKGDQELEHKLKVILLEAEVMRQDGKNVPSNEFMKVQHWEQLLKLDSRSGRRKYFDFLFKVEKRKENEVARKEIRKIQREQNEVEPTIVGAMRYDLGYNNIMMRVYETTMNQLYNNKLVQAMRFGQKLVIDCGYHDHMTNRENVNCAKQLMYCFSENRVNDIPFDIHYCNIVRESSLIKAFNRHIPPMYDDWFPINLHEKSYLDLFPKENLVYLTPHCREELTEYDHDAIYIIGGIVDKINNEPVSLAKAKREGLKMAKLPLDRYLQWGAGSGKSLTLNQMVSILLDIKNTKDWNHSLRHVPRRKLVDPSLGASIKKFDNLRYDRNTPTPAREQSSWKPKSKTAAEGIERKISVRSLLDE